MSDTYDPAEFVRQRMAEEIADISSAVSKVTDEVRARLPERHFREIYLPMFAGDKVLPYDVDLNHWVNFAGNPYREVDIIDEAGKVLFTVPPILDRNAVNPISQSRQSISHVIQTAQQYSRIHPHKGMAHLNAELTERALIMKVPANVLQDLETWNTIFKRFGRPPIVDTPASAKSAAVAKPSDDFDFEPF